MDGASSALEAAAALAQAFDLNAARVRADAHVESVRVSIFGKPLITAAVVAGHGAGGAGLLAVGLTSEGQSEIRTVGAPLQGLALGPATSQAELDLAMMDARASRDVDRAIAVMGGAVEAAAVASPGQVSLDWDHVIVTSGGATEVVPHRFRRGRSIPTGA
jgi:hypothetical protein